ncbi:MFS transporter [Streptomyces sp. ms191]|uniref:MFS transporter n=1 Tax=Streptomyces sp. ms191 TaxID=1827978 RepID=UPI0011CDFF14|nr:MFS transporter [Streptomyces sp. ms191]TXS22119.1 MFS transporter [Streptomyces sp. ms191]
MALSSSDTGTTGVDSPAAPRPTRGLLPLLLAGNAAMYALYVGVPGILLALQIEGIDPANKVANFGLVSGVSAIFATVFNPVAGALSDRSGRRNPWILAGGLLAIPVMFLLGSADTILLVMIAWCLGQAVMNVYQAALTSVVPDRVPLAARGRASAAVGLGLPVGSTVVALLVPALSASWTAMLVFSVVNGLGFGCYMAVDTALVTMVLPRAEDAARDMGVLNIANAGPQIVAPFVASLIVSASGGYPALFLVAAVLSVLGALAVRPIRSVR